MLSSFSNSGQICLCGSRILVEASIYDEFVSRFVSRVQSVVRVGPPADPSTTMGSVISFAHRDKIERMVRVAESQGGRVLLGGRRPSAEWAAQGAFLEPTIIEGLGQTCEAVQEEIFGPVVTIQRFHSDAEALALANGVRYVWLLACVNTMSRVSDCFCAADMAWRRPCGLQIWIGRTNLHRRWSLVSCG